MKKEIFGASVPQTNQFTSELSNSVTASGVGAGVGGSGVVVSWQKKRISVDYHVDDFEKR